MDSKWAGFSLGMIGGLGSTIVGGILTGVQTGQIPAGDVNMTGLAIAGTVFGALATVGRARAKRPLHYVPGQGRHVP